MRITSKLNRSGFTQTFAAFCFRIFILLLLIVGLQFRLLAQKEICGFDPIYKLQMKDPQESARINAVNTEIGKMQRSIQQMINSGSKLDVISGLNGNLYQIPVVVHVMHRGEPVGATNNPSDATIQSMIDFLNQVYAGTNTSGGLSTPVRFVLAKRTPDCQPTNGINRVLVNNSDYNSDGVHSGNSGSGMAEADLKALSRWPRKDYYNIWIVWKIYNSSSIGTINGYAYFPTTSNVDGIVLIGNVANGTAYTLPHEMGHAMALYHTFQSSLGDDVCELADADCNTTGDRVCDTDPHTVNWGCPDPGSAKPCLPGNTWGLLPKNIMGYFNCRDRFTTGQGTRLLSTLLNERYSLISSMGGTPPWTPASPQYITVQTTNNATGDYGIGPRKVVLGSIFYESTAHYLSTTNIVYEDRTCMNGTTLNAAQNATIEVTTGITNRQVVKVWINLNNNNTFEANELIGTSTTPQGQTSSYTHTITIPAAKLANATPNKPLRMRVAADYVNNPDYTFDSKLSSGQMEDYTVIVDGSTPLPVNFGMVTANLQNGALQVNWQSESETNNEKFQVQLSNNGEIFYTVGEQMTKAKDGNSSNTIDYSFSIEYSTISKIFSSLFLLAFVSLGFNRKRNYLHILAIASLFALSLFTGYSCNKEQHDTIIASGTDLFARIAQVDKDGVTKYSKVVKVIRK